MAASDQGGFLRSSAPAGQNLGPLVIEGGAVTFTDQQGFLRAAAPAGAAHGALAVVNTDGSPIGGGGVAVSASNSLYTSGTVRFIGGANITVGTDAQGVVISGAAAGTGGGISGISASNTVFTSGTVRFTGGPNVTVGSDASGVSISGAADQTAISGVAASNTTYTSGTVTISGENNITVHSGTGQRVLLSGPNTSAQQTGISGISASNSVFTSGTVRFTGGPNVTVGTDAQGVSISGPNPPAAQTGISGISASNSVFTSGTVRFTGGPNVTVGTDASGVSISANDRDISAIGASNTTYTSGKVDFTGAGGITVGSDTGQKITISGPNKPVAMSYWRRVNFPPTVATGTPGTAHQSVSIFPLDENGGPFPADMTAGTMGLGMSWNTAATSVSQQLSSSLCLGLYTLNGASFSLISSGSVTFGNTGAATVNGSANWHGPRWLTFAAPTGLSTYVGGSEYYMGLMFSSHVTTIAASLLCPRQASFPGTVWSNVHGDSVTATNRAPFRANGIYSAATAALPATWSKNELNALNATAEAMNPMLLLYNGGIP